MSLSDRRGDNLNIVPSGKRGATKGGRKIGTQKFMEGKKPFNGEGKGVREKNWGGQ